MGNYGTDVTLPMRDILNANPASIRVNERGVAALANHIEEHGLQLPILVAPDYLVLSGCRRLAAYELLGWTRIPVVVTADWARIAGHFKNELKVTADLGLPSEPLLLREFEELVDNRLRQMFEPERRIRLSRNLINSRAGRPSQKAPESEARNGFNGAVASMLDMTLSQVTVSRDIMNQVRRCQELDKDLGRRATEALDLVETHGGRLYSLQRLLKDLQTGVENVRYRLVPGTETTLPIPQKSLEPNPRHAAEQVAATHRILDMLETLGEMVNEIGDLNVAVDPDVADALKKRYGKAQRKVGLLRSYLNVHSVERE
jgi:hypothetical protein